MDITKNKLLSRGKAVIHTEAEALFNLSKQLSSSFVSICEAILASRGRVVVLGMGKSGHIGAKIAATLASTGTPAFFVHPGEASHGDLGMITQDDIVLALSNSGETLEILTLLPALKRFGISILAVTGNPKSTLAQNSSVHIHVPIEQEACTLGLAPTSSTTAMLALGDALAIALLESKGFSKENFALSHPGGSLGKRLLLTVESIMHKNAEIPAVKLGASLQDALIEMTRARLGTTAIVDENFCVKGIFTDGDLRRVFEKGVSIHVPIQDIMTTPCYLIKKSTLAAEALRIMETRKINALLVVEDSGLLIGALN
ncbi:MAG TPA: KpsF/GutQ family sugar-phosphate isomerase, partial [Gammaproteobacteria bacterium]|nr:KpsF/GutQ family sugar-phosphate isomerase [Gammaproteobacteria bacterium]